MHVNQVDARAEGIREHRELRGLLAALQARARASLGVLPALIEIHEHLKHHFAAEEAPRGLFDTIREASDWHAERANALQREHKSLLTSVEFIASRIGKIDPDEAWSEIEQFIALMRAHEISEGVLYQDAMQELRSQRSNVIHLDHHRGTKRARLVHSNGAKGHVDALAQPRLLILEDKEHDGRVLSRMLREDGFDVEVVHDDEDAIERLAADPMPDAIIATVLSRATDGRTVAAFARSRMPGIPVVFITAYPDLVDSGPDRLDPPALVHEKPIEYRELASQLSALLGGSHAQRKAAADE